MQPELQSMSSLNEDEIEKSALPLPNLDRLDAALAHGAKRSPRSAPTSGPRSGASSAIRRRRSGA
jgi:hypothetical protein